MMIASLRRNVETPLLGPRTSTEGKMTSYFRVYPRQSLRGRSSEALSPLSQGRQRLRCVAPQLAMEKEKKSMYDHDDAKIERKNDSGYLYK